jgi:hypothetical protein
MYHQLEMRRVAREDCRLTAYIVDEDVVKAAFNCSSTEPICDLLFDVGAYTKDLFLEFKEPDEVFLPVKSGKTNFPFI